MNDYYGTIAYLNHESQGHTYLPLWWQADGWLKNFIETLLRKCLNGEAKIKFPQLTSK